MGNSLCGADGLSAGGIVLYVACFVVGTLCGVIGSTIVFQVRRKRSETTQSVNLADIESTQPTSAASKRVTAAPTVAPAPEFARKLESPRKSIISDDQSNVNHVSMKI
jgi:hypothetical protein